VTTATTRPPTSCRAIENLIAAIERMFRDMVIVYEDGTRRMNT
jgi:hypothetical protein